MSDFVKQMVKRVYSLLYNDQINARALIGQSAVGDCYYKPTEKSRSQSTETRLNGGD